MKCNQCQTEFEGKFCPNCGAQAAGTTPDTQPQMQQPPYQSYQPPVYEEPPKKKKKPFYKRWWFIAIIIIAVAAGAAKITSVFKDTEKIRWDDMILGEFLPEPPKNRGEIHTNTEENLWVEINNVSMQEFTDYSKSCEESGFSIDKDSQSTTFSAYNDKGYKLRLSYYESYESMEITADAPMEFSEIKWPESEAGKQLPAPKSLNGKFSYEHGDGFSVYISNMTKADFSDYVSVCYDKGFNLNYDKSDEFFSADNSGGWHITARYEGNSIISISVDAPEESDNSGAEPSAETTAASEIPEENKEDSGDIDPDFKEAMDSYEEFIDEYVEFMKKYMASDGTDLSIISDYANYMKKYAEFADDFKNWETEDLNTAETAYYIEVQARVTQKLLEISE